MKGFIKLTYFTCKNVYKYIFYAYCAFILTKRTYIVYFDWQVHMEVHMESTPLRPVVSMIRTAEYNLKIFKKN